MNKKIKVAYPDPGKIYLAAKERIDELQDEMRKLEEEPMNGRVREQMRTIEHLINLNTEIVKNNGRVRFVGIYIEEKQHLLH